ncbi:hypothetical protein [Gorillibacterium timonense]|uniref:hypothetical protein n=1 Tax=Gorillibacterium timonense TaxID=1689269 RepID=UPI00071C99C1|nr:hypothetical protein [Gorillibacterium timonense]
MEKQVSEMIRNVAKTQAKLAHLLAVEQPLSDQTARLIGTLTGQPGEDTAEQKERGMEIAKNLTVYLDSLARLELTLADQVEDIFREWNRWNEQR